MEPREFHWPISRIYSCFAELMEPAYNDLEKRVSIPETATSLLELGGGDGRFAVTLAKQYKNLDRIVMTDISPDMVTIARQRIEKNNLNNKINAEVQDVQKLSYADNSFDVVVSTFSLHHWRELVKALCEIQRVVKPGGLVYIFDGYNEVNFREIRDAVRRIGGSKWLALFLWLGKRASLPYKTILDVIQKANIMWLSVSRDSPLIIISGSKPK